MKKTLILMISLGLVMACNDKDEPEVTPTPDPEGSEEIEEPEEPAEPADFEEHLDENYVIYFGEIYKTATLSNGTTWFAENLRYLPEGYEPSSDPTTGSVWYPYETDGTNTTALTDDASVEKLGYLYSLSAAMGEEVTTANYRTLEDAQGICPEGWHIPNRAEWFDLVGASNKSAGESAAPANYEDAVLWDATATGSSSTGYATVGKAIEMIGYAFNGVVINSAYNKTMISSSNCTVEDYYGEPAVTYIWTSSAYQLNSSDVPQFFVDMSTFTASGYPQGRQSLAYCVFTGGAALRCVKDSGIDFYAKHTDMVRPSDVED